MRKVSMKTRIKRTARVMKSDTKKTGKDMKRTLSGRSVKAKRR